jgi:hypothetical protein
MPRLRSRRRRAHQPHLADLPRRPPIRAWDESRVTDSDEEVVVHHNWREIRRFMWDYVGIVRTTKRLERALQPGQSAAAGDEDYYGNFRVDRRSDRAPQPGRGRGLIVRSALTRQESRGLHYTLDYPDLLPDAVDTVLTPAMAELSEVDQDLRGLLTRMIAERGHAPTLAGLVESRGLDERRSERSLRRLHDAHACCSTRSLRALGRSSLRLVARLVLGRDARTGLLGELPLLRARHRRQRSKRTRGSRPGWAAKARRESSGSKAVPCWTKTALFHLSIPAARWWDNVIARLRLVPALRPRSRYRTLVRAPCHCRAAAVMSLDALWRFASDWYGNYLDEPWRKAKRRRDSRPARRNGLTGPFWEL